jgi:L-asparaginase / beta-aspartyl-peptidase
MKKLAVAIHGGAGVDSEFIRSNRDAYDDALKTAAEIAYQYLNRGKSSVDAVEAAVMSMEDNPLFNCGHGSALNGDGRAEMEAAIMEGRDLRSGAAAILRNVKNPIALCRMIMENTKHNSLGGEGALAYAKEMDLSVEPDMYFVTVHRYNEFIEERKKNLQLLERTSASGTVGAIALDRHGNLAAATSTGGSPAMRQGRIGDSAMPGIGCYANNNTCAVCATGTVEIIIGGTVSHALSSVIEYTRCNVQDACDFIVHKRSKPVKGNIGVISLDPRGNFGIAFNSERMPRAWISSGESLQVRIY